MKFFLILFVLIFSINSYAEDKKEAKELSSEERFLKLQEKYNKKDKKKENSWFFIYYSLGKTVDKVNNTKFSGTSSSIGYKKVKEKLIQGYEYNIISNKKFYKIENYKLSFGYKPSLKFKYSPYVEYQFGISNYKDLNNDESSFGYINSLELGFFVKRFLPIHLMGGTRFSTISYDKDFINNVQSQEIFFRLGFEF